MKHELWMEPDDCQTFCQAGPGGDSARALLGPEARLVWVVDAESHFDAMSQYYAYMDWGEYRSDFPAYDKTPSTPLG
ncbi:hypothetical protein PS652_01569 [Pseudomonas fluorescens]|uniref:Uncharacterized protein n=1 Tax=Pseudomonas fluorescens TaxID=294 RepID=A0A5E6XFN1_PSEFL|nr:hypothetical protein PS652_05372 [Pseudomonas fluorescens]